jgi:hypothetical protein
VKERERGATGGEQRGAREARGRQRGRAGHSQALTILLAILGGKKKEEERLRNEFSHKGKY